MIRRFEASDSAAVADLIAVTMRTVNIKDYTSDYIEAILAHTGPEEIAARAEKMHMYVCEEGGRIVSCAAVAPSGERGDECCLYTVFVLPELQGRGLGRQIMDAVENDEYFLRAKRAVVPASITAAEFYRKLGYEYEGGRPALDSQLLYRLEKQRERS